MENNTLTDIHHNRTDKGWDCTVFFAVLKDKWYATPFTFRLLNWIALKHDQIPAEIKGRQLVFLKPSHKEGMYCRGFQTTGVILTRGRKERNKHD